MKKITVKNLIDFRRKSERSKLTFLNKLKQDKVTVPESGGDYWVSCVSAICNAFKKDDQSLLGQKVNEIKEKLPHAKANITKTQFLRNIEILENFEDFDLNHLKPNSKIKIIKQSKDQSILQIGNLPIEAKPSFVFSFSENGSEEVGAVWFVAKLNGYDINELGMFADIIYRYLNTHHSNDYFVNPSFCIAIDVFTGKEVKYIDFEKGVVPAILEDTVTQFNSL